MSRPGFTIIELMVTVTIISLLITVTAISLNMGQANARDARRLNDVSLIGRTVDAYAYTHAGSYPVMDSAVATATMGCADELTRHNTFSASDLALFKANGSGSTSIPADPAPADPSRSGTYCLDYSQGYLYVTKDPTGVNKTDADALSRAYVIEVALEHLISSDESQFRSIKEVRGSATLPAGRAGVYILSGPVAP